MRKIFSQLIVQWLQSNIIHGLSRAQMAHLQSWLTRIRCGPWCRRVWSSVQAFLIEMTVVFDVFHCIWIRETAVFSPNRLLIAISTVGLKTKMKNTKTPWKILKRSMTIIMNAGGGQRVVSISRIHDTPITMKSLTFSASLRHSEWNRKQGNRLKMIL